MEEKSAVLTTNVAGDPQFEGAQSIIIQGIKSVICVPLWNGDSVYGLIYLDSPFHENTFNESNLQLLSAMANLVTMKIENFLFIQELLQKKAMEKELELASDVQRLLIQPDFPPIPGFGSAVFYQSCLQLGGDYYHCFPLSADRYLTVIADVMGKGTGAALLTASLHAYLQSHNRDGLELRQLMEQINQSIHELCEGRIFVTLFAVIIDRQTGTIEYCNAGHNPALLVTGSGTSLLNEGGPLMGFMPDSGYQTAALEMNPGDLLLLYTDGLTETENPEGDMMGMEGLTRVLTGIRSEAPSEIMRELLQEIRLFQGGAPQRDDLTGILFRRLHEEKTC